MARDKTFRVRLTQQEFEKLESNARQREISSAELIRDYIKRLPNLLNSGALSPVVSRGTYGLPNPPLVNQESSSPNSETPIRLK
jgi:hypothetical protein